MVYNKNKARAIAQELLGSDARTAEDINEITKSLKKMFIETALEAELEEHLGYEKGDIRPAKNARNGYGSKQVITEDGSFEIETPRDREASFEPQLVKKRQRRFTGTDGRILSLYAKGMSSSEIVETFKELYDADISPSLISRITDMVMEQVEQRRLRPLEPIYPIVYLDCLIVKVRQDRKVINKV